MLLHLGEARTAVQRSSCADAAQPYRAREYGVARYSRVLGGDFQAADEYPVFLDERPHKLADMGAPVAK
jgi:hypothetical protein